MLALAPWAWHAAQAGERTRRAVKAMRWRHVRHMAVDLVGLARRRRALWILPVLVLLLLASALLAGGQAATPFLYTIF